MLDTKSYRSFLKRMRKILNGCQLSKKTAEAMSKTEYYDYTGSWEATEHIHYYYDAQKVSAYKNDVLELCRDLPKLNGTLPDLCRPYFSDRFIK